MKKIILSLIALFVLMIGVVVPANVHHVAYADGEQFTGSNLSGTNWEISANPTITSGYGWYLLDFSGDYAGKDGLAIGYNMGAYHGGGDAVNGSSAFIFGGGEGISIEGATIEISGGTDAGSETLIAWLNQNATWLNPSAGGGDPATGVIEDAFASALFAVVVAGAVTLVALNKKKNNV